MAGHGNIRNYEAGEDLSGKEGYLCYFSADDTVKLLDATAANQWQYAGVIVNGRSASGETVSVAGPGAATRVKLGGTIAAGEKGKSTAAGKAEKASADGAYAAVQMEEAGVDGDMALCTVLPMTALGIKMSA